LGGLTAYKAKEETTYSSMNRNPKKKKEKKKKKKKKNCNKYESKQAEGKPVS